MEQPNKGRLESILSELGRKLDETFEKAREASGEARQEFASKMADVNKEKERLEKELKEFANDEEKWKEVKIRLQNAADELRKAFEITFSKKEETK